MAIHISSSHRRFFRYLQFSVIVVSLISLIVPPAISQVKIRERVSIHPSDAHITSVGDHNINVILTWTPTRLWGIDYLWSQPIYPGGNPEDWLTCEYGCVKWIHWSPNGSPDPDYIPGFSEVDMIGHGGFLFSPFLAFDEYTTYAQEHFSVYVDGRLAFKDSIDSVTVVLPDPYYYLTQWKPIYLPIFNRADIELSKELDTMQSNTKQYINVTGSIVERCDEVIPTWCAFVDKVTYEIESGSEYAQLYNFDKDTVYGTTVTDFTSDSLKYLCLEAVPGAQGDSVNMVVIRVTVNGITKRDSIFIVPRDTLFVTFDPPKISPGGTSNIILKRRVNGVINDLPESQSCEIGIIGGCNYGKLVTSAGEGNYFCDVVPPFQFVADSTIDTTDAVVAIRVGIFEGGGSIGKIMPAVNRPEKIPVLNRLMNTGENNYRQRMPIRPNLSLRGKSESAKSASEGGCNAETFQYESFTTGEVEVEDKCPPGTECTSSKPSSPVVTVQPKKSGEVEGEYIDCSSNPNDLASFRTFNADKSNIVFQCDESIISVCCNEETKSWILHMSPLTLYAILDFCPNNIAALQLNVIEPDATFINWSKGEKCKALHDFSITKDTYPVPYRTGGYVIREMLQAHEEVHMSNYKKAVDKAIDSLFNDNKFISDLRVKRDRCKNSTEAIKYFKDNIIPLLMFSILDEANKNCAEKVANSDYELNTQKDSRVKSIIEKYQTRLGVNPVDCAGSY